MITTLSLSPAKDKIILLENFEVGKHYRTNILMETAGGKGINVAKVVSELGEEVTTTGFKAGITGEWLESQMSILGIIPMLISVEGECRTNTNIVDVNRGTETELLEIGPCISERNVNEFIEVFEKILQHTKVLVCSGGLPVGVSENFYKILIDKANQLGIKSILDSSDKPLEEGMKGKPYLIKPNRRELSKYAGMILKDTNEIVDACRKILSEGVEIVVTSLGSEGAILVSNNVVLRGKIAPIEVVNTIGSGDSMVAGLAFGLSHGYSVIEMFRLGMACGIANTQFTEIGMVSKELVQKYLREVEIDIVIG